MKKSFKLYPDDGWPPAEVENLWLKPKNHDTYTIESTPFFVKGVALGDKISLNERVGGDVENFSVIEAGGNSTVWVRCESCWIYCELLRKLGSQSSSFKTNLVSTDTNKSFALTVIPHSRSSFNLHPHDQRSLIMVRHW